MGATFVHKLGHDAVAIAKARREKNRERKARALASREARGLPLTEGVVRHQLWQGEVPRDPYGIDNATTVTEEKTTKVEVVKAAKAEDPLKHLRQGGRVPVEVLVWLEDEPIKFQFSTNLRGSLMPAQRTEEALRERIGKVLKDALG